MGGVDIVSGKSCLKFSRGALSIVLGLLVRKSWWPLRTFVEIVGILVSSSGPGIHSEILSCTTERADPSHSGFTHKVLATSLARNCMG